MNQQNKALDANIFLKQICRKQVILSMSIT